MTSPAEEIVRIVDADNREIAAVSRRIMRDQKLIHQATYILVLNRAGELFIQKRTMTKDIYPGYWEVAAGGVVQAGEDYETSARRELEEELGIRGVALRPCFDQFYEDQDNRVWGRIFLCTHDGPFVLQEEEVACGRFVGIDRALRLSHQEPFTPDGIKVLERLLEEAEI